MPGVGRFIAWSSIVFSLLKSSVAVHKRRQLSFHCTKVIFHATPTGTRRQLFQLAQRIWRRFGGPGQAEQEELRQAP
jgi:hypothetical protein